MKKLPPANDAGNTTARISTLTDEEWEVACATAGDASETGYGECAMFLEQMERRSELDAERHSIAEAMAQLEPEPLVFLPLAVPEAVRGENNLAPDGSGALWSELEELVMAIAARSNRALRDAARDPTLRGHALTVLRRALASFGGFPTFSSKPGSKQVCSPAWAMLWLEASAIAADRVESGKGPQGLPIECGPDGSAALVAIEVRERISDGRNGLSVDERAIDVRSQPKFCATFASAIVALRGFRSGAVASANATASALEGVVTPCDDWPSAATFRDVLSGRLTMPHDFEHVARALALWLASDVEARQHEERERVRRNAEVWQQMHVLRSPER